MTYLEPEDDIVAKLEEARIAERDEALAQAKKLGATDPEGRLENTVKLAEKWAKFVEETDGDKQALIDEMEKEIYSKVQP